MKATLMVTTCLLAFAFSSPTSAHQTPKEPDAKLQAQPHVTPAVQHLRAGRTARAHASVSEHVGPGHGAGHRPQVAANSQPDKQAAGAHLGSVERPDASSSRHGRFVAARNRTAREARNGGSEGGSVGLASYYSASGLTAAHRTLPFGTRVRVTNLANGHTVIVRINDRGPFIRGRSIDLSAGAARAIGMTGAGIARVRMHVI